MKKKYLLPCSCGEKLLVDPGQAGQRLTCTCGRTVEAPSMRAIRQLPPAPETEAPSAAARGWSLQHGVIFATGLLGAAIALGAAVAILVQRSRLDTTNPAPNEGQLLDSRIEGLTVDQSWDLWQLFLHEGVGVHSPREYILAQRNYRKLTRRLWTALGIAAAGAAAAAGAFLFRPPPPAKPRS